MSPLLLSCFPLTYQLLHTEDKGDAKKAGGEEKREDEEGEEGEAEEEGEDGMEQRAKPTQAEAAEEEEPDAGMI